jgi:hypothetical protein
MLVMIINRTDDVRMLIDRNRLILIACVCVVVIIISQPTNEWTNEPINQSSLLSQPHVISRSITPFYCTFVNTGNLALQGS